MSALINISDAERAEIARPASQLVADAREFKIVSAETYELAADKLKAIKSAARVLEEKKKRLIDPINTALREARALFHGPETELQTAEGLYKRGMIAYSDDQERVRKEEQRRLDAEAERRRLALEEQARKAREQAEAERAKGNVAKADKLEQKADLRQDTAASTVAPTVQREPPRVAGIATRENWYAVVTDLPALVKAVAEGKVPITALEANMKFLNNQARAMKRELAYPGVTAARDSVIAAGTK